MHAYRLYLFDFDYTLVNSEPAILKCFHITLQKLGYGDRTDDVLRVTIGLPMVEAVKKILPTDDEEEAKAFVRAYTPEADRYMTPGTHFFPDTLDVLRALRARGARIGIISSKTRSRIQEKFDETGTSDLIDRIIGIEDVKAPKPAPEGIEAALRAFGAARQQTLYVGDSVVDAGAAQQAAVPFAAVLTGASPAAAFDSYPDVAICQNLRGLLTL